MKKIVLIFLATIALLGCGKKSTDSYDKIKEQGKFIVGLDDTFAPMGFRDENGEIVGFDIDLAKEVASRMGVEAEFSPREWSSIVFELKSGNIDMVWNGMTITPERQEQIAFSEPYFANDQIIMTLSDNSIQTAEDLKGKIIGVQLGSSSYTLVMNNPISKNVSEIKKYATNAEALMDLEAKRIDAVVIDVIVGEYYAAKKETREGKDIFKSLDKALGKEEFGIGLRKEDKKLKKEIDRILGEMKKDGTFDKIHDKWFGGKEA
ncbi:amino acid ABC transporter substrate-binding protein [uncultured Ilyobacter sp.]|uniref:amino acid ABC transporter substrate-binding protein n=1 Tax=uncultured Ilyobacter sp. TaxID=544433 RepID=UPI0029F50E11|nr:amino acid ABC transporter substrate-binding protein [uncultured Ilyobacter sp.]